MNISKKMICILAAGATLGAAAPVFADAWHGRGYERHEGYRDYDRHEYREHERYGYRDYGYRDYGHRTVIVERPYYVQRSYVVQPPVYYSAPVQSYGPAQMIGSAIGGIIDSQY